METSKSDSFTLEDDKFSIHLNYELESAPDLINDLNLNHSSLTPKDPTSPDITEDTADSSGDTSELDTLSSISVPSEMENYDYNPPHPYLTHKYTEYINSDQVLEADKDDLAEFKVMEYYSNNNANQKANNVNISQSTQNAQYVTIGTHNICKATEKGTQWQILDHIYPNFTILGLSETKLTTSNDPYIITKDDPYIVFWASSILLHNSSGVGILIKKPWNRYVTEVLRKDDHLIAVSLKFKHCSMLVIVQVYLSSNVEKSKIYQETLEQWSEQWIKLGHTVIIIETSMQL